MNIKTFNKVLLPILEASICPWIWGAHAKGKSEVVENFYKSRGWRIYNERLNTKSDVGDIIGLQDFLLNAEGQKISSMFMVPEYLRDLIEWCKANPDKRACIFFDEVNRAGTPDIMGPLFQMSLDRRLNMTVFPKNLDIILASNPSTGDYSVLDIDDEALISRFWHVYFNPTVAEWFEYATENKYDSDITGFIEENPTFLEQQNLKKFSIDELAKPDRRKWGMTNKLYKDRTLDKDEQTDVFSGLVGINIAVAFEAYLEKLEKPLTVEEITDNYPVVRQRLLKATTATIVRNDIINNIANKVKDFFKDDPSLTDTQGTNVIDFIRDLPAEQMFGVMFAIYRKRKFHDFCEKNFEKLNMAELQERLTVIRKSVIPESLPKL